METQTRVVVVRFFMVVFFREVYLDRKNFSFCKGKRACYASSGDIRLLVQEDVIGIMKQYGPGIAGLHINQSIPLQHST